MSVKEANAEYREIALLAYENAMDLYEEARLLLKEKKSPRAFALAVASCEELVKSYLCNTVWSQGLDPETLWAERGKGRRLVLTDHRSKHGLFALFLFLGEVWKEGGMKALEETAESINATLTADYGSVKKGSEIMAFVGKMEERRKNSIYVGVKPVTTPKKEITPEMCKDLLGRIEDFLPRLEGILPLNRDQNQEALGKSRELTRRRRAVD